MNDLVWAVYRYFIDPVLMVFSFILIAWVVVSWLLAFGIINQHNPNARMIVRFLNNICEPICAPIRRVIPPIGGLDLSVLIAMLGVGFLRGYAVPALISMLVGPPFR